MIKRTVEISSQAAHLTVKQRQLLVQHDKQTVGTIPCEDLGMVLVDHPGTTYTHAALTQLVSSGAALVICNRKHLPAGVLLPMSQHTEVVWRLHDQIEAARPLKKQLWKQIVQAKIRAQANALPWHSHAIPRLKGLARNVRSGDPENVEAQAAKIYWQHFLGDNQFRRDRDASDANAFLNYGYAILRAAVARALISSGLMPALGIHHHSRSNPFCLADDIMEPLRPMIDMRVRELYEIGYTELNPESKRTLLEVLTVDTVTDNQTGPLWTGISRMTASLAKCFAGEQKVVAIPKLVRTPQRDECDAN